MLKFSPSINNKLLFKATLIYVSLPTILFFGGWLKLQWSLPLLTILVYLFYKAFAGENKNIDEKSTITPGAILTIIGIAGYIAFSTGAGGMVEQSYNYVYDNIKLYDLIVNPWPVLYPEKQAFYCYYFGFYLPIALATKLSSNLNYAEFFSFIWAWGGVVLCVFWVYLLLRVRYTWMVLVFLLAGTLCTATTVFNTLDWKFLRAVEDFSYPYTFLSTWWSGGKQILDTSVPFHCSLKYASTMTTMAWGPYHYISGILFPSMVYYQIVSRKTMGALPLIAGAALIWSPFVVLGLVPLVLIGVWRYTRQLFTLDTVLAIILFLPFVFYFGAHSTSEEMVRGFIWECGKRWWLNYLFFVCIEVGLFSFAIFAHHKKYLTDDDYTIVKINIASLLLIPFIYLGFYNDFSNKVGIVPMFFLVITFSKVVCRILEDLISQRSTFFSKANFVSVCTLILWCLCAITPLNIVLIPVTGHPGTGFRTNIAKPFDSDSIKNLSQIPIIGSQFIGDVNAPAIKVLFRENGQQKK